MRRTHRPPAPTRWLAISPWFAAIAIAVTASMLGACAAVETRQPGEPLTTLEVVLFPLSAAAPIYVASDQGFYRDAGLDVRLTATPDSRNLVAGLVSGRYQLGAALIDNFVAYQEGQHAVAKDSNHDVSVLMGLATTSVALIARPEIRSVNGLRGRAVGLDATGTGFAFVLYAMLEEAGLSRDDLQLIASGSTKVRGEALARGDIDATLLTPEFAARAVSQGFQVLRSSDTMFPAYMGMALAAERTWVRAHPCIAQAFVRATLAARRWMAVPDNLTATAQSVTRRLGGNLEQTAASLHGMLEQSVLIEDGSIDAAGFDQVLVLRREYGWPQRPIKTAQRYLEQDYLAGACAGPESRAGSRARGAAVRRRAIGG